MLHLVDHSNKLAFAHDENTIEGELREVEVDERHRRLRLHREGRDVEAEALPHLRGETMEEGGRRETRSEQPGERSETRGRGLRGRGACGPAGARGL